MSRKVQMEWDMRKDKTSWQADLVPLLFWNHETKSDFQYFLLIATFNDVPNVYIAFVILCKQNMCKHLVILWCRNFPFGPSDPCFGMKKGEFLPFFTALHKTLKHFIFTSPTSRLSSAPLPLECVLSRFGHVRFFATLRTVAHQAPLSMEFSRQE